VAGDARVDQQVFVGLLAELFKLEEIDAADDAGANGRDGPSPAIATPAAAAENEIERRRIISVPFHGVA
jgi:hypothetical protein